MWERPCGSIPAGNDSDVQWAVPGPHRDCAYVEGPSPERPRLPLRVTSDLTGKELRAKVTYKTDDNTATPNVDESRVG